MQQFQKIGLLKELDLFTTILPFVSIVVLCSCFVLYPAQSADVLSSIRYLLGDQLGSYYLIIGFGVFVTSIIIAFSRLGDIRLGDSKTPKYSSFKWGAMIFTAGLAADILFYSLCEWMLYGQASRLSEPGVMQDYISTYPLFHFGPIPWGFFITLAVAFGFMLHVRKRGRQKYSEACRPLFGNRIDGWVGKLIDLIAVFALIAGTATTFSLATPLMSMAVSRVFGVAQTTGLTILILLSICGVYTAAVYFGMKGIQRAATCCAYLMFALLAYVFLFGGESKFIVENGLSSLGNLVQNFVTLSTWTDPLRTTSFPQSWAIFYWAYWMVWTVATPFFIGAISQGRTIRQTIFGGYFYGLAGTYSSIITLGNYSLGLQLHNKLDILAIHSETQDLYETIIRMLELLPFPNLVMILLFITMVALYATSFDSIALVASSYSYKNLGNAKEPDKRVTLFWAVLLILFPIALIFSENSMNNLQTVSIIAAFPLGIIMVMIITSFVKDARSYLAAELQDELEEQSNSYAAPEMWERPAA